MTLPKTAYSAERSPTIRYAITGSAAHSRIQPLLPADWMDVTGDSAKPDFLWENAPRHQTRPYRDQVAVYSHLPNGTDILDSKWVLARLFEQHAKKANNVDALTTHCFRGTTGFTEFCQKVGLRSATSSHNHYQQVVSKRTRRRFRDLLVPDEPAVNEAGLDDDRDYYNDDADSRPNLWVIKDASSNGAGGIWVVSPKNTIATARQLHPDHRYVAQEYVWPLVLYSGRKCHVRVYALILADGRAFCHRQAFLHVANDAFDVDDNLKDSVHITNCCANSHAPQLFAGEICADLEQASRTNDSNSNNEIVGLSEYAPSMYASVAHLGQQANFFLEGGQANHGFEYLGLDFILSSSSSHTPEGRPVAYLLEVNAPPSQDTATGLPHAEALHDCVLRDLLALAVLPVLLQPDVVTEQPGGWRCVYQPPSLRQVAAVAQQPSKAALLNKMRWALWERKQLKQQAVSTIFRRQKQNDLDSLTSLSQSIRRNFPYYWSSSCSPAPIFFENAGGAQVPRQVQDAVCSSLSCRDRSVMGAESTRLARLTLRTILGSPDVVVLGPNASSLLQDLAVAYMDGGLLTRCDEIVLATDNHLANVDPWLRAAESVGAIVKWWTSSSDMSRLQDLLTPKTRIVAIPHASNLLGQVRDVAAIQRTVQRCTAGYGHTVVDGVAAAPHTPAQAAEVDWYVVSCHKLFGPHLGALCGRKAVMDLVRPARELGTLNYEACQGVVGLGDYLADLASLSNQVKSTPSPEDDTASVLYEDDTVSRSCERLDEVRLSHKNSHLDRPRLQMAYEVISTVEEPLIKALLEGLQAEPKVRVFQSPLVGALRIPVVAFAHNDIPSEAIVKKCREAGVICRCSTFLATKRLLRELRVDPTNGVVRFSLAHYNTLSEVRYALKVLQSIAGWSK